MSLWFRLCVGRLAPLWGVCSTLLGRLLSREAPLGVSLFVFALWPSVPTGVTLSVFSRARAPSLFAQIGGKERGPPHP